MSTNRMTVIGMVVAIAAICVYFGAKLFAGAV